MLRPYEDQGVQVDERWAKLIAADCLPHCMQVDERWAQKTPQWARKRLGVEFMS